MRIPSGQSEKKSIMSFLHRAAFFITAAKLTDLTFPSSAEVAFVGRSNSGKSSAINTLANQRRLAFTSKTPGRTQQLNYFGLGLDRYLVDLPGYGYAKVQKSEHKRWGGFLSGYLQSRAPLVGMVLIMDARRPLTELDCQMLEWFTPRGIPVHALLTKADKLGRSEQSQVLRKVQAEMAKYGPMCSASLFSSLKKTGVEAITKVLAIWLGFPVQKEAETAPTKNLVVEGSRAPRPERPLE
jgi:GTP-binding protein